MISTHTWKKYLILAGKVGLGSALAIFLAHVFELSNPTAAGTVTLLTLVTRKRETIRLFFSRILTFFITVALCLLFYPLFTSDFLAFGVITFFLVLATCLTRTENTLSVCALINMHFFAAKDHSGAFILNEFWLILIGICIAFVLNMIQDYKGMEDELHDKLQDADQDMAGILQGISVYILNPTQPGQIWNECRLLEHKLEQCMKAAMDYQNSRLSFYGTYYRRYFEMRTRQLHILRALHPHLKTIRSVPRQAKIISEFMEVVIDQMPAHQLPQKQMDALLKIRTDLEASQLPQSRDEFESRAILFHIIMDLEMFLKEKEKFILTLDEKEKKLYNPSSQEAE